MLKTDQMEAKRGQAQSEKVIKVGQVTMSCDGFSSAEDAAKHPGVAQNVP